jgi:hypothetical protein
MKLSKKEVRCLLDTCQKYGLEIARDNPNWLSEKEADNLVNTLTVEANTPDTEQNRLHAEYLEAKERVVKLNAYYNSETRSSLDTIDQSLLFLQLTTMATLTHILEIRSNRALDEFTKEALKKFE